MTCETMCNLPGTLLFGAVLVGTLTEIGSQRTRAEAANSRHAMGSSPCIWWAGVNKRDGSTDVEATVRGLKAIGARCGVYPIAGKDQSNSYRNFEGY